MYGENRFKMLTRNNPDEAKRLAKLAQDEFSVQTSID
jgi:hypothetical protein